jgi:hypothetical protein
MGKLSRLNRKCPKFKREQMVKVGERRKTISCRFCGTNIPPNKTTE